MPTQTVPSRTYQVGPDTIGPVNLTAGQYSFSMRATTNLPGGRTFAWELQRATTVGGAFTPVAGSSVAGPQAANVVGAFGLFSLTWSMGVTVPAGETHQVGMLITMSGGSWTTGWTVIWTALT